jgi:hypothetical protein
MKSWFFLIFALGFTACSVVARYKLDATFNLQASIFTLNLFVCLGFYSVLSHLEKGKKI